MQRAERSRAGSARPSPSRPSRCRPAAACPAARGGASGKNVEVEADEEQPEVPAPEPLAQHPAGDLREPVVEARRAAGTPRRRSARSGGARRRSRCRAPAGRAAPTPSITPVSPPSTKMTKKPSTNSSGVCEARPAGPERRDPAEDLHAGRESRSCMLAAVKKLSPSCGRPVANMWCTHRPKPMNAGRDQRQHHRRVAEDRPARERRDDRRDHAERRHEDDVDLGMAEEPEQVLPQQRVAAFGRVEEVRADQPVEDQRACSPSITAGIAKMTMNAVTSIAQTNSGMRSSDMPGARSLKTVTMISTATTQRRRPR